MSSPHKSQSPVAALLRGPLAASLHSALFDTLHGLVVEDGEIVRRIRVGDREAEGEFCRRFGPRIRLYGLRHFKGNADAAADLVQSVLLAVLEAARSGRIEQPDIVARFVLGTCRNTVLRTRADQGRTQLAPGHDPVFDVAGIVPRFERLDSLAVMRCMQSLDERSRTVLMLSFEADREAEEIATLLETSAGNVRVIRHRALSQLRTCVEGGQRDRSGGIGGIGDGEKRDRLGDGGQRDGM